MNAALADVHVPGRVGKGAAIASAALSAATAGVYWRVRRRNPYRPLLESITIPVGRKWDGLHGLKIGFITDIHAGPFVDSHTVQVSCDLLAKESPDLMLFGGDFVSESPRYLTDSIPVLGELARAAPLGALAVLGNHDIFVSAAKVTAALESVGIQVLRNDARAIERHGCRLWIAGIDDSLHGSPDLDRAFGQVCTDDPVIALWHEPQFAAQTAEHGAIAQLSGHSHGGQVKFPGVRPVWLPRHGRRHISGLSWANGMRVYTSRGTGIYRPPFRFNCPPEVTLVTLVDAEGAQR